MRASKQNSDFSFYAEDWLSEARSKVATKKARKKTKHQKVAAMNKEKFPNQAKFMRVIRANEALNQADFGKKYGEFKDDASARQTISEVERGNRGIPAQMAAQLPKPLISDFVKAFIQDQKFQVLNALREYGVKGLEIAGGK